MKHCKTCRRNLEDSAYETDYKTCNKCRTKAKVECPTCKKKLTRNDTLQRHINEIHLKIKNYKCDQCEYSCSQTGNLQEHINVVHLKLKNFQCPSCEYKCSQNNHLQAHMNTVHLKMKEFACTQCDSKFGRNSHLTRHIPLCTGEINVSAGEYKMLKQLEKLGYEKNIDFLHNTSYWNVRDKGLLRWDFVVNHTSDNPQVLEFDGRQHFMPVGFGGSVDPNENFISIQRRDKIKNDYCKENNIPILRISYLDIDNIETLISGFLV